ncbi:MAG: DnaJ domain-containing protein [Myxococcota bacterium]|nr:DnaJ domain-containing protein [Myxococcota bacterium]
MLGVLKTASQKDIAKAYHKLVARYHPDRHTDNALRDLAEEKLTQLNEAYETLSDPARRAAYDLKYRQSSATSSAEPTVQRPTPPPPFPKVRVVTLIVIVLGSLFALRFVRSPRAMAVIAAAIAVAWFGPRIYRLLTGRKK